MAKSFEESQDTWLFKSNMMDDTPTEIYISSFYFTVATLVTVGYGDIHAQNMIEMIISCVLQVLGVFLFSMGSGAISSLIINYDQKEALFKAKISTLNWIARDYKLSIDLFNRLAKTIRYDHSKQQKSNYSYMEELPSKLRLEIALVIHQSLYESIDILKDKDRSFIVWISGVIRQIHVEDSEYIYQEGEEILESKVLC